MKSNDRSRMEKPGKQEMNQTHQDLVGPEGAEPKAQRGHVPVWLIVLFGIMFYWGQLYLDRHSGEFNEQVYEPFQNLAAANTFKPLSGIELKMVVGKQKYEVACMLCHQPTGLGLAGQFPPLAGSEWVTAPTPERLIRITLHGLSGPIEVKGQQWNATMPAMGASLTDEELASVLTYIRGSWGNQASEVTVEQVQSVKAETANRVQPWTAAELMQVQVQPAAE